MAITPTVVGNSALGGFHDVPGATRDFIATGTINGTDTYAAGGFSLTPAMLGLSKFLWMGPVIFSNGYLGFFIPATNLIKVFSSAGTEYAGTTALQSTTFTVFGTGRL